ncbi:hypothetical protein [Lentzea sp. NBRC 105346]|uniref:hypothetical protein n=1 Tax=Lentzea sp. NBRC 105346 TaxID=3032205 RepID=UPI002552AAD3|nr:hypothetical protein [Lentzea sp. NBRC 105346]
MRDPGVEYTWLVETSDDGSDWWTATHPVHRDQDSGGMEWAVSAEEVAERVLARQFTALRGERDWDWEELWFRVTVWDHANACDWAGWQQPPYLPEKAGCTPQTYGAYLRHHGAEPHAVEVRVPRQVRAAVHSPTGPGLAVAP